jgi:acyl-CoA reductase-like NAD-dependent aldehyde dehydrogenase
MSADPRVDMITFTGSTATGRAILAAGAPTVKKTLLELGDKSAHIVLDDADFNAALPMAATMACVMDVAKRMRTGNVTINGKSHFGITSPFGGTKQSGLGYRNGEEGYKEYLEAKTIGMPE